MAAIVDDQAKSALGLNNQVVWTVITVRMLRTAPNEIALYLLAAIATHD